MRVRYLVLLVAIFGLGTAACAESSSLRVDPNATRASGGADDAPEGLTGAGVGDDGEEGPVLDEGESGEGGGGGDGSGSSSEIDGWVEIAVPEGEIDQNISGGFGDLGEVSVKAYDDANNPDGEADIWIVDVEVTAEQASMMMLMEQMGNGGIGETIKIRNKKVIKLADDEFSGCMLMWTKSGRAMSIAQGPSCDVLIPAVEQII